MNKLFLVFAFFFGVLTSGVADTVTKEDGSRIALLAISSHASFNDGLRDYESARFQNVTGHVLSKRGIRRYFICGQVNAKNGFGGYGGWSYFIIKQSPTIENRAVVNIWKRGADSNEEIIQFCSDQMPKPGIVDSTVNYGALLDSHTSLK